ncbi:hypothetical protein COCNU_13G007200 [Cocos nucifera]|uniref:Uncharacterized protein n=1 Tax=Cocos nucifera TaxID=13894 RepID=A0A8K0NCB2_COCNU|nr:hypothetical protein COCNU_13G007200 [Cocos nucifera]
MAVPRWHRLGSELRGWPLLHSLLQVLDSIGQHLNLADQTTKLPRVRHHERLYWLCKPV